MGIRLSFVQGEGEGVQLLENTVMRSTPSCDGTVRTTVKCEGNTLRVN